MQFFTSCFHNATIKVSNSFPLNGLKCSCLNPPAVSTKWNGKSTIVVNRSGKDKKLLSQLQYGNWITTIAITFALPCFYKLCSSKKIILKINQILIKFEVILRNIRMRFQHEINIFWKSKKNFSKKNFACFIKIKADQCIRNVNKEKSK